MPIAATAETDYKWPFDVRSYPIDFSDVLPEGILLQSVAVTRSGSDSVLQVAASGSIRTGNKIVDIVYWSGTAGVTYTVVVDATGNGAIGGQTWQQRVKFQVVVST